MRFIARKLGLHRNSVKKYILRRRFPGRVPSHGAQSLHPLPIRPDDPRLAQSGQLPRQLGLRAPKSLGYAGSYETVKRLVRPIKQQQARLAHIRFETMPGMQAKVDWADFQISEPDGSPRTVYLFILVLGYCRPIYAEFVNRCTLESFLDGHIHAFRYLGGVISELLYDHMKHVVIRLRHRWGFAPRPQR